ncbi:MAG: hypothetical protein AB4062_16565 [Crocosphaera sp.]
MATKAKELIKLAKDFAKEKGFELSKTEKKLLTSVAEGKPANYIDDSSLDDGAKYYPIHGNTWDETRSPNVDIIIWLCTDKQAISYLTHRGINVIGAKIDGCLDLDFIDIDVPLIFRCCYFTGGTFFLSKVKNREEMTLGLILAKINCLSDKQDGWTEQNKLYLEGLVYNSIDNLSPVDSQSRLKWIRLQNLKENFYPQPYEQLAKILRMSGHEEAAKDILIAKYNDRRHYGELKGFRWGLNYLLSLTIDHGYRTQKIFGYLLLFIILGSLIFSWGESQTLMSPSRIKAYSNSHKLQEISDDYPKFNALMYSVDVFVPIIDFHQESYWLPNANIKDDIEIPLNYSNIIHYKNACIGSLLRWYLWFHIAMGWFLTTLSLAGFTGLVRRLE